jgi:hypothetical protein
MISRKTGRRIEALLALDSFYDFSRAFCHDFPELFAFFDRQDAQPGNPAAKRSHGFVR